MTSSEGSIPSSDNCLLFVALFTLVSVVFVDVRFVVPFLINCVLRKYPKFEFVEFFEFIMSLQL